MGDRFTPGEHQCAETPCFDCGRGLDPVDFVIVRQLRRLRREVAALTALVQQIAGDAPPRPAVGIRLTLGGHPMSDLTLSVDAKNEVLSAVFVDDKNEPTTGPLGPDGVAATFSYSTSDSSIVGVDPTSGALTLNLAGQVTFSATAVDSTGTPIAGFPVASSDTYTIEPGAAVGARLSVTQATPPPAP